MPSSIRPKMRRKEPVGSRQTLPDGTLHLEAPKGLPHNDTPFVLFSDGDADEHKRTWACTRGSSLVRSPNGSLLAFFSGMESCSDGVTRSAMLLRTSADNGASWSAVRTLHNFTTVSGYLAPIVDSINGSVVLYFNVAFVQTWMRRSTDDGTTWSDAVNVTAAVGALALGRGVQLAGGRQALSPHAKSNFALLSDDGGRTWRRGGSVNFNGSGLASGGESQLVDNPARGPRALVMTIRVEGPDGDRHHALCESNDAGETWSVPVLAHALTGPTCEGSVARRADGTLLLSAPDNTHWRYPADRRNMHVWALRPNTSAPGGYSAAGTVEVWHGPSAYSGLTREGDFILFEGGPAYRYQSVMVARVPAFSNFRAPFYMLHNVPSQAKPSQCCAARHPKAASIGRRAEAVYKFYYKHLLGT